MPGNRRSDGDAKSNQPESLYARHFISLEITSMKAYEDYYESGFYDFRYPVPNKRTMRHIAKMISGIQTKDNEYINVLDLGCGSGRYAIPLLLKYPRVKLVGVDPSNSARSLMNKRAILSGVKDRLTLYTDISDCNNIVFDCVFMIFGVLSHMTINNERAKLFSGIKCVLKPDGALFCSVPNIYRRFPILVLRNIYANKSFNNAGSISYKRNNDGKTLSLKYYLYSPRSLKIELLENGFKNIITNPESILPETYVTNYTMLAFIDNVASSLLPSSFGYGISAIAYR